MNLGSYVLESAEDLSTFEFISTGRNGRITKLISYSKTSIENVFNLAFGDKDLLTGEINDFIRSNNGDSEKVLATVATSIWAFAEKNPEAYIYIKGSTKSRTRFYQMGISKYYTYFKKYFEIYAESNDTWELFREGNNYTGFLVKKKISNLD